MFNTKGLNGPEGHVGAHQRVYFLIIVATKIYIFILSIFFHFVIQIMSVEFLIQICLEMLPAKWIALRLVQCCLPEASEALFPSAVSGALPGTVHETLH